MTRGARSRNLLGGTAAAMGRAGAVLTAVALIALVRSTAPPSMPPVTTAPLPAPPIAQPTPLPRSVPVHLSIPSIDVSTTLSSLGLNSDGTMAVPPFDEPGLAGWYRYSPTPGQRGPSVIVGHVFSTGYGRGVFYRLGQLRPGDQIRVRRRDHRVVRFRVDRVASYAKSHFPAAKVYGNVAFPGLRLITCTGNYQPGAGYADNMVVYATAELGPKAR